MDKKLNKYLEKHQEAIISANVDKKIAKWDKSCSLEQVVERLYVKDVFEFLEERIYAKPYDDKNKKDQKKGKSNGMIIKHQKDIQIIEH